MYRWLCNKCKEELKLLKRRNMSIDIYNSDIQAAKGMVFIQLHLIFCPVSCNVLEFLLNVALFPAG